MLSQFSGSSRYEDGGASFSKIKTAVAEKLSRLSGKPSKRVGT
jgi:hypothetical protein